LMQVASRPAVGVQHAVRHAAAGVSNAQHSNSGHQEHQVNKAAGNACL
jgi:hypothetical protein